MRDARPRSRWIKRDKLWLRFAETRGVRELSGIPLYLTLLAILWQGGGRPPEKLASLYDEIFELLLEGRTPRTVGEPIPAQARSVRRSVDRIPGAWV